MSDPIPEFEWDDANVDHLARHRVRPVEAEEVIRRDPIDLQMQMIEGEERLVSIGTTATGRVLVVVTTPRAVRIRVITAFEPEKRLVRLYYRELGRR